MNNSRRDFLKATVASVAGISLMRVAGPVDGAQASDNTSGPLRSGRSLAGFAAPKLDVVRWGIIGVGARGTSQLRETLQLEGSEVRALCDIREGALTLGLDVVAKAGKAKPTTYGDGPEAYRKMIERDDLDAIMICTPWRLHVPMAVASLRAGKHVFVEVPGPVTIEECWQLVDTAEETRRHCMMLENCCYGRDELMLLNLCRQGVLGELLHAEAAYIHDLRFQLKDIEHGEGSWRPQEHELRNGNLYPTHGLGPVAQYMGINRGDKFDRLVSFSSPALGLADYAERNFPPGDRRRSKRYACGDMNTSVIKTARGRTIVVQHDTTNPQPYSRANLIKGTRGVFAGYPCRIYVENRSPQSDQWETDLSPWYAEYEHPLWKEAGEVAAQGGKLGGMGHGGMDFVMKWRIMQCLREGLPLDQSVYDAAAWAAVAPLSEKSVAQEGASVEFPDFTRGAWTTAAPLGVA